MSEELLGANALQLMDHHSSFHRVLQAASWSTGESYIATYEAYAKAAQNGGSVADTLHELGADLKDAAQDLRTLEAASEAKRQATMRLRALDRGEPSRIDDVTAGEIMAARDHGGPVWARLLEARRLPGGERYADERGPKMFMLEDAVAAESGVDLLGQMRRTAQAHHLERSAQAAQRRLEDALERGGSPKKRRMLLQAAVAENRRLLDAELAGDASSGAPGRAARHGPLVPVLSLEQRQQRARALQQKIDRFGALGDWQP